MSIKLQLKPKYDFQIRFRLRLQFSHLVASLTRLRSLNLYDVCRVKSTQATPRHDRINASWTMEVMPCSSKRGVPRLSVDPSPRVEDTVLTTRGCIDVCNLGTHPSATGEAPSLAPFMPPQTVFLPFCRYGSRSPERVPHHGCGVRSPTNGLRHSSISRSRDVRRAQDMTMSCARHLGSCRLSARCSPSEIRIILPSIAPSSAVGCASTLADTSDASI